MACVNSFLWIYTIERVELILARDITPYQLENHALVVILSIPSMVSIHSLQLYVFPSECLQKKNYWEGNIGTCWGEGVKKSHFPCSHVPCLLLCSCLHTIRSIYCGLTFWKLYMSYNRVVDLKLESHRVFINSM